MKKSHKILIGILGLFIVAGFVLGVIGFIKGLENSRGDSALSDKIVSAFQKELIDRALARGPMPIEGFEATMLLDIFPGLEGSDFDGVATGAGLGSDEGMHTYIDGKLQWERISNRSITSAERTVSQNGYGVLLENLSERLGMPATNNEEAIAIIDEIDIPADITDHIISKRNLIRVHIPRPLAIITSPLTVYGEARGTWYFEADFQLTLVDWDGRIIAESFATARDDWMTEEFVPFEGTIEFKNPSSDADFSKRGTLIFQKANPSGLSENDDALEMPVLFE